MCLVGATGIKLTEPMLRGYLHGAWAKEHFGDIPYYRSLTLLEKWEYLAAWTRGRIARDKLKGFE